jgi:hypothetical protein
MPWLVYALMIAWLAFAGCLFTWAKRRQRLLPEVYLEPDLLVKFFAGKLPEGQQRLLVRYMLALFTSLVVLAVSILVVMVAQVSG